MNDLKLSTETMLDFLDKEDEVQNISDDNLINLIKIFRRDFNYNRQQIEKAKIILENAKEGNEKIKRLNSKKVEIENINELTKKNYNFLEYLKKVVINEDTLFKERRVEYLNNFITQALDEFFPYDNFRAKIVYDDKYNKTKARLVLLDDKGKERSPSDSEGCFCNYLLCYTAITAVIMGLGYHNIYVDEAFSVADMENLPKVGELIYKTISNGMQVILIAQNPLLYNSISRREFHLEKDIIKGVTTLEKTLDL